MITANQDEKGVVYDQLDELQQYSRRECLESSGTPKLPDENQQELIIELGSLAGVEIDEQDISTVHRLPDTKASKDRMIVKFTRRAKKEELYKNRRRLVKVTSEKLPSISRSGSKSKEKLFINESLTPYRKRLFGKINRFKKDNGFKFLWTQNGKILLKEHESSRTYSFTKESELNTFLDRR